MGTFFPLAAFMRAAALAAVVLLAAGCGASPQGGQESSTSSTPAPATTSRSSAAPSPTPTTPNEAVSTASPTGRSAERYPDTPAGAEAFVRAFWSAYNLAATRPDTVRQFSAMATSDCVDCGNLQKEVDGWRIKKKRVDGTLVTVTQIRHEPNPERMVIVSALDQHPRNLVDSAGAKVDTLSKLRVKFALTLSRVGETWKVSRIEHYVGDV